MTRATMAIAANTFREALRQRVLYIALGFMLFMVVASQVLSPLALGEAPRIVRDVGLSAVSLCGVFIIVMLGTSLLHRELERRSIFVLLSKPLTRGEYLLGKYAGLTGVLACVTVLTTLVVWLVDRWMGGHWSSAVLVCGFGTVVELAVLTAWTMVFSAVASPFLAGTFTLACYLIGNAVPDLRDLAGLMPSGGNVLVWISYGLPNLYLFNFRPQAAQQLLPEPGQMGFAVLYAALHGAVVLYIACALFRRREFA